MAILVVGGAGYIGSHMTAGLVENGIETIVVDSLVKGHRNAVWDGAKFYQGDILDSTFLDTVFTENKITAVVHFAAYSIVPESMTDPSMYFSNNVAGTLSLLTAMKRHGVEMIVFSSTAAVYGMPEAVPIVETAPESPINPYGESKLMVERMLKWFDKAYGMRHVVLRYFNVAGAHDSGKIGEDHHPETHLIPIVLQAAAGKREGIDVFGSDYSTPDGTCIRDYIHVCDLVDAHVLALKALEGGGKSATYNLGSGTGFSNLEVVTAAKKVTGIDFAVNMKERRPGDPDILIASSDKIIAELGWKPTRTNIENILRTAWAWHSQNPEGFLY